MPRAIVRSPARANPSAQVGIRAGRRGATTLGNRPRQFINAEGVASNSTANHAKYAKIKTGFPFAYLAYFAVCLPPATTPSELFSFAHSPKLANIGDRLSDIIRRPANFAAKRLHPNGGSHFPAFSKSSRLFKSRAAKPITAAGEGEERILQHRREDEALQPFCPAQPPGKKRIAIERDFLAGGVP